ncbi:MAG: hypothetical protein ABIK07_24800 [Planctomycetota bacterium]|uniref:hypothetical protein n=1 Tax=uncultured Gimesia sp. TaxID=1678688 RepID=UPI002616943C|nr:hypothetical protein [uncultured Gimesia sp.]
MSLSNWLKENFEFQDYLDLDDIQFGGTVVERHRFVIPDEFKYHNIITCIREPFERWESFYLYQSLQMGADLSFEEFTRQRLNWLPRQTHYTKQATYILRVDQLDSEVNKLPFARYPIPEIPRLNVSQNQLEYDRVKDRIKWTDELLALVTDHFREDCDMFRNLT